MLALGGIIPLTVFWFCWKMATSSTFERHRAHEIHIGVKGWIVVLNAYKWRLVGTCLGWGLYNAVAYPFGLFSSIVVDGLSSGKDGLITSLGYGTLINALFIPGYIVGAFSLD